MNIQIWTGAHGQVRADKREGGCDTPQFYCSYPGAETTPTVPNKVLRYFEKVCPVSDKATLSPTPIDRSVALSLCR